MHDTRDNTGIVRHPSQFDGLGQRFGGRLLGVDVLAGLDGRRQRLHAPGRHLGVEVDVDRGVGDHRGHVGGPFLHPVLGGQVGDLVGIAADQDGLDSHPRAVLEDQAGIAERQDGAQQVLAVAHPSGHAVHRDAQSSARRSR